MFNSKVIELLQKMDSRSLTRLEEYLSSPYINKHIGILTFGKYLIKEAPSFKNHAKLESQRIYAQLFPNSPFDEKNLHRLASNLLQLIQNFLIDEQLQEQKNLRSVLLMKEYRKLKLEKHYRSTEKQYQHFLENTISPSSSFQENQYKYHKELDAWFVEQGGRVYHENLQLANDCLDHFFILEKLKMACDMANRNKIIQANYQWTMITEIENYLQTSFQNFPPIIQIYYTIFQMLTNDDEKAAELYQTLKNQLQRYAKQFAKEDIMQVYGYALNYSIGQINKKGAVYLEETLNLYQYLVSSEAIFVGGYLMEQEYKNIVTLGIRLERYSWTENFIENYKLKLPADTRINVYKYNLASLQYGKGDYKAALNTLHDVNFTNDTYYLGTKIIQLKIFYELNEADAFYSLIDACLSFLHRSKTVADYQKKSTTNLLKFSKKLFKIKEQQSLITKSKLESIVQKFKSDLQICNFVANKDWLETSLKKLEQQQ